MLSSARPVNVVSDESRQVFASAELPDSVLELIALAEVPAEFDHLDRELEDGKP